MKFKKTELSYKFYLLVIAILWGATAAFSQNYMFKKMDKAFKVSPSVSMNITSKYGDIHVVQTRSDSVSVSVKAYVKNSVRAEYTNVMNNITFVMQQSGNSIVLQTQFNDSYSQILSDFKTLTEPLKESDKDILIQYEIKVPSYLNLTIHHKFGDIKLPEHKGKIDITLQNGKISAPKISGNININLSFGLLTVYELNNSKIDARYSKLELGKISYLELITKSCTTEIDNANILKLVSKRDKIDINSVNSIFGDAYFSTINADLVNSELSMTTKYGNIKVQNISEKFLYVNVDSKYTDLLLFFQNGCSYKMDVTHVNVSLIYPTDLSKVQQKYLENKQQLTFGTIGKENTNSKVKITAEQSKVGLYRK